MEPFKTRGYLFGMTLKYCRESMHSDRRQRVLDGIPPETVRFVEGVKSAEWYPVEHYCRMLDAIVDSSDGDDAIAERDLIDCGKFAANEATNTFLRLLMKVLTPALFAKKLPSLFERDFNKGKVRVDVSDDRLVCTISDCKGHRHLGPMSTGWATFALESMGKSLSSSTLTGWSIATPDVDELTFELVWRT